MILKFSQFFGYIVCNNYCKRLLKSIIVIMRLQALLFTFLFNYINTDIKGGVERVFNLAY